MRKHKALNSTRRGGHRLRAVLTSNAQSAQVVHKRFPCGRFRRGSSRGPAASRDVDDDDGSVGYRRAFRQEMPDAAGSPRGRVGIVGLATPHWFGTIDSPVEALILLFGVVAHRRDDQAVGAGVEHASGGLGAPRQRARSSSSSLHSQLRADCRRDFRARRPAAASARHRSAQGCGWPARRVAVS